MFLSEIMRDIRVDGYIDLENGLISVSIKPEYIKPELNISTFETEPSISQFLVLMDQYALPA